MCNIACLPGYFNDNVSYPRRWANAPNNYRFGKSSFNYKQSTVGNKKLDIKYFAMPHCSLAPLNWGLLKAPTQAQNYIMEIGLHSKSYFNSTGSISEKKKIFSITFCLHILPRALQSPCWQNYFFTLYVTHTLAQFFTTGSQLNSMWVCCWNH